MTKISTSDSYLVRVYRVDSDDPQLFAGQVESLDGSGARTPFTNLDELMALLNSGFEPRSKGKRLKRKP